MISTSGEEKLRFAQPTSASYILLAALLVASFWFALLLPVGAQLSHGVFENLGVPVSQKSLGIRCVTHDAAGRFMAWGAHESPDGFALVGIDLKTGEVSFVNTTRFGLRHIQMSTLADGNLYAFTGLPGHFLKYDVNQRKLFDMGAPAPQGTYWEGSAVGPDGKFYVGTYPNTELVRIDSGSGRVDNLGPVTKDSRDKYIVHPTVSSDNIVYCPVGMNHCELWSVNAKTGARKQILPVALMGKQGYPNVWLAADGRVYGRVGNTEFLCLPNEIRLGPTKPPQYPEKIAGDKIVGDVDNDGKLTLSDRRTGRKSLLQTTYAGETRKIFSVSCERNGRIYGGTISPAHSFCYDTHTGQMTDLGQLSSGPVQLYDTLNHPKGLFFSSYMNASVDYFNPELDEKRPDNPRRIITLSDQERPMQLVQGPDGMIYTGTVPSKGRLGGDLVRINPDDFTCTVWKNVIPNQSILRLAAVPETGELLCTTSISGGSSAIPTEKEACIFLWDCRKEAVVFRTQPLKGAKDYGAVVRAKNGIIWGVSHNKYYAFDPRSRQAIFTGLLPVRSLPFPELSAEPVRGLIYGIGDNAIFAINPTNKSASIVMRDPALEHAYGFYVTSDDTLYFGSGSHLMRCHVPPLSPTAASVRAENRTLTPFRPTVRRPPRVWY